MKQYRHHIFFAYCRTLIIFLALAENFCSAAEDDLTSHRILVKVGTENVTQKDFDEMGEVVFTLYFPNRKLPEISPGELEQLNPLALREMVIVTLAEDEMKTLKGKDAVKVSAADITKYMRDYRIDKLVANRLARRYAAAQLGINQMLRTYVAEPSPPPRRVRDFYDQYRDRVFTSPRLIKVRHIFFNDPDNDASIERRARRIYDDLRQQTSPTERSTEFRRAARSFSEDRFKQNEGLLLLGEGDFFPQNQNFTMPDGSVIFPQAMLDGISTLQSPGELEIRHSDRGWHILLLEDAKGGENIPYSTARKFIEDFLGNEAMEKARRKWLEDKTKRTLITWNDGSEFPVDKLLMGDNRDMRLNFLHEQIIRAALAANGRR